VQEHRGTADEQQRAEREHYSGRIVGHPSGQKEGNETPHRARGKHQESATAERGRDSAHAAGHATSRRALSVCRWSPPRGRPAPGPTPDGTPPLDEHAIRALQGSRHGVKMLVASRERVSRVGTRPLVGVATERD
jgi:hypothetical protein